MSGALVVLVGERAEDLREALCDCGYQFRCCKDWASLTHHEGSSFVVSEIPPPDGHFAATLPHLIMRPAFAWENGEFIQNPPGWEFTRQALIDRVQRELSGRGPMKMMIVDDESGIRTAMRAMLSRFGLDVTAESDRNRSLQSLADGSVELLLTDVNMPGMGWQEYVAEVNRLSPGTLVYLATGDRDVSVIDGVQGILHKPFGLAEVAELAAPLLQGLRAKT